MQERRRFKRRLLVYHLEVFDAESGESVGRMVDITPDGMMLVSNRSTELNSILRLWVDLPSEVLGNKRITFTAKAQWCRHDINPDLFDTGLQFTDISDKSIETIIGLIIDFAFPD